MPLQHKWINIRVSVMLRFQDSFSFMVSLSVNMGQISLLKYSTLFLVVQHFVISEVISQKKKKEKKRWVYISNYI